MPVNIQITVTGTPPISFSKILEETIATVDASLASLADGAVDHMRGVIKAKTYRSGSTGRLSAAIQSYKIEGGYGIGDKSYLNLKEVAPYWAIINYGGYVPIYYSKKPLYGNFEGFAPDSEKAGSNPDSSGKQKFTKGAFPLYKMQPEFPIMPKNYIEDTVSWIVSYMDGYNLASKVT